MEQLIIYLSHIFKRLFHLSCTASILILMILFIKTLLKNKLGFKFHYAIWFILILKLIVPFTYESSLSIFNIIPIATQKTNAFLFTNDFYIKTMNQDNNTNVVSPPAEENITFSKNTSLNILNNVKSFFTKISLYDLFSTIWIAGMLLLSIYTIVISIIFNYKITHSKVLTDKNILNVLEECKNKMDLKKAIPIIELEGLRSPAIIGFITPKILIPINSTNTISINEFHYVFLHELCHFKRKDTILNYLIRLLCIFHWFNPLIWYAFYKMRQDRELCCDATTLSYITPNNTKEYGHAIINLFSNFHALPKVAGISGMIENKSQIKKRIILIKSFKKDSCKFSIISLIVLFLFACVILTDAKAQQNIKILSKSVVSDSGVTIKVDNTHFPFFDDATVIGKWDSVDFVTEIANFNPNNKNWKENLFLKNLTFKENGEMNDSCLSWTKGVVIHPGENTASTYTLKEINGSTYMFFEWKSGDYVLRDMVPSYYVLKKTE